MRKKSEAQRRGEHDHDSRAQSGDTNRRSRADNKKGLGDPVLEFPAARVAEGVPGPLPEKNHKNQAHPASRNTVGCVPAKLQSVIGRFRRR